jgi:HTH-type transcriptional regulator / antitoxin HipB
VIVSAYADIGGHMRITTVEELAGAVRRARKERGWTQAELASHSLVSRDLVNRLERGSGRVEVAKVLDILAALGLLTVIEPRRAPVDLTRVVRAHEEEA